MENNKYMWILIIFFVFLVILIGWSFWGKINVNLNYRIDGFNLHFKLKILWKEIAGTYQLEKTSNVKNKGEDKLPKKNKKQNQNKILKLKQILKFIEIKHVFLTISIGLLFQELTFAGVSILSMLIPIFYHNANGKHRIFRISNTTSL